jgi:DNA repair exonuclease SbcCD ATPase subunit
MEERQNDKGTISTQLEQEKQRRKDAEQRAQELHSELEEEKTIRPDTEQRFNDLKATLDRSEAERKELEGALSQEKEKASHLEADANLLTEIRRLLGASLEQTKNAAEATPVTPSPPPEEIIESPVEEMPETLTIKTHSGETVIFRPPFALSSREVELIKLVAGEDEITAEQIKIRTGRKRAVDDLDELLDRLLDGGFEPIIEDNDVYWFDTNFLHDER